MICFLVTSTYPMQKHNGAFLLECGPSAIIDMTAGRDDTDVDLSIHLPWSPDGAGVIFNSVTVPGFLMSFLWGLLLIGLVFLFDEPLRVNAGDAADDDSSNSGRKEQTNKLGRLVDSTTSLFQVIFENGAFPVSMAPSLVHCIIFYVAHLFCSCTTSDDSVFVCIHRAVRRNYDFIVFYGRS